MNDKTRKALETWAPIALGVSACAVVVAIGSCEQLKPIEPAARALLESADTVCVQLPEEDQQLCGDSVTVAQMLLELHDQRVAAETSAQAAPSAPPTATASPVPSAPGGRGGS